MFIRNTNRQGITALKDSDITVTDPELKNGEHCCEVESTSELVGQESIKNRGILNNASFFRGKREQFITVGREYGAWALGGVPCIMTESGLMPLAGRSMEASDEYSGKFCEGSQVDLDIIAGQGLNGVDAVVSVDGERPQVGDIGVLYACPSESEHEYLFFPHSKKKIIDALPLPVVCFGPSSFKGSELNEGSKIVTSVELEEGERFIATLLKIAKNVPVFDKGASGSVMAPNEIGQGLIFCKNNQELASFVAANCTETLDYSVFIPGLVPGELVASDGSSVSIFVIKSDMINDLRITASCCDEEEEEEPGQDEFPEFVQYSDSFGITQTLKRNSAFPSQYASNLVTSSDPFPNNELPSVLLTLEGNAYQLDIDYRDLSDIVTPSQNDAVREEKIRQQNEFGFLVRNGQVSCLWRKNLAPSPSNITTLAFNDSETIGVFASLNADGSRRGIGVPVGFLANIRAIN